MKQKISLLLALLTLAQLAACGDSGMPAGGTTSAATTPAETTAANPYNDNLPEGLDYEGYKFRILTFEGGNATAGDWLTWIDPESETGEVLNDAAYNRNLEVEERLNISIECSGELANVINVIYTSALADSDEYDYAVPAPWDRNLVPIISSGGLYDLTALPYMQLDQPYYSDSFVENFNINGHLYAIAGDYTCTTFGSTWIWTNMDLWKDFGLEDPYALVRSGKWTFDKMLSLIKDTYRDLDGDSERDIDDQYGVIGIPATAVYQFIGGGGKCNIRTSDGIEFPILSERNISLVEKIVALMNESNVNFDFPSSNNEYRAPYFDGRALMFFSGSSITLLRDCEFYSGLLPFPKYDEAQEKYISYGAGGHSIVPATITDPERTGAVIEALFSASSRGFKDAFYQQYVDNKVFRDEGSVEMFDIIYDSADYDFTVYIDPSNNMANNMVIVNLLNSRSTDLTSAWASIEDMVTDSFEQFFAEVE